MWYSHLIQCHWLIEPMRSMLMGNWTSVSPLIITIYIVQLLASTNDSTLIYRSDQYHIWHNIISISYISIGWLLMTSFTNNANNSNISILVHCFEQCPKYINQLHIEKFDLLKLNGWCWSMELYQNFYLSTLKNNIFCPVEPNEYDKWVIERREIEGER